MLICVKSKGTALEKRVNITMYIWYVVNYFMDISVIKSAILIDLI